MSTKKYFPILTETACRLKWSWSTLYIPTGSTSSCHRASNSVLTPDTFASFHNTPEKIRDRETMLEGKWPGNGCEYCRDPEKENKSSDRQFQLTIPDIYPDELDSDRTLTTVDPVILELFIENTCNLACIYCNEKLSSRIEQENKRFGGPANLAESDDLVLSETDFKPAMWAWLEQNYLTLKRLQILGGEPLIQKDFLKLLDFLETHPHPTLELNIVSNLMLDNEKRMDVIIAKITELQYTKCVGRIDILASVDCWGPQQEYIRYGFDCDIFERNFLKFLNNTSVRLGILSTCSSLSLMTLPLLVSKFNEWYTTREIFWYMHTVLPYASHIVSPTWFDGAMYKDQLVLAEQMMLNTTWDQQETKKIFLGIVDLVSNSVDNSTKQTELRLYLNEIDVRRNLNWRETFPWLIKVLGNE